MAMQDLSADELIRKISIRGDRYGSSLLEFLETYNLMGLREATESQLREFFAKKYSAGAGTQAECNGEIYETSLIISE